MSTTKRTTIIIAVIVVSGFLTATRVVLGPIYRMRDGCACGQERAWLSFGDFAALRHSKLALQVLADGDRQHHHQHWDATWDSQFWWWESSPPPPHRASLQRK
jgi:hypothetical protein